MASKKQKSQSKEAQKPQSDPWRTWSEHVHVDSWERQDFSDNPTGFVAKIKEFKTQRLLTAKDEINQAADEIVLETFDAKDYPVYELATLEFKTNEYELDEDGTYIIGYKSFSVGELLDEQLFITLKRIAIVGGLPETLEVFRDLAPRLIRLLMAGRKFFTKKIALANAMGLTETAEKLERACKEFCMIELTCDIDADAKRLFLERKITPDEFRVAMRRAFKLDGQATEEINNEGHVINLPHQAATSTLVVQGHGSITGTQKADECSNGAPKKRQKKRGRKLDPEELKDNVKKNELITEIRRRAEEKYHSLGKGITRAYDEICEESKQPGSKWYTIIPLAERSAFIDKARHDKRYVV